MQIHSIVKKVYNKLFFDPYRFVKNHPFIKVGNSKLGRSFRVEFRMPRTEISFVAGHECILFNQNIFESIYGFIGMGNRVVIGDRTQLISINRIEIGDDVMIGWGCTIYDHDGHSLNYKHRIEDQKRHLQDWDSGNLLKSKDWSAVSNKPIKISNHVWIGFDVVILKGVSIGEGAIIASRSVVTSDIPSWTIAAGVPARVIREIPMEMRVDS